MQLTRFNFTARFAAANAGPFPMAAEKTGPGAGLIKMAWADRELAVVFTSTK